MRLPLIGPGQAGGHTAYQLEGNVEPALENGYLKSPRVNVEVTTYRPFYIIGQVNRPGQYPYTNNMSALDAVGVAGGFTDHAVESTLYIRHEGEERNAKSRRRDSQNPPGRRGARGPDRVLGRSHAVARDFAGFRWPTRCGLKNYPLAPEPIWLKEAP